MILAFVLTITTNMEYVRTTPHPLLGVCVGVGVWRHSPTWA